MTLTISQKGLVLVAVPMLFQLAFVLLVVRIQTDSVESQDMATHSKEVLVAGHEFESQLAEALAAARGFVLVSDPDFAAQFDRSRGELAGILDRLERLVSDNPGQLARVRAIRTDADAAVAWYADVIRLVQGGNRDEALARIQSRQGKQMMAALSGKNFEFLAEEERLARLRSDQVARTRQQMNALFVVGGVVAVASTSVLAYLFHRGIGRRFAALGENIRRLAAGQALPEALAGDDELARLDHSFRGMARELTQATERVRDLYDRAPCGYHSVDPAGTVVAMNTTELQWLGYEAHEVLDRKRFVDVVDEASRPAYQATFDRVKAHGSASNVELDLVRRDGSKFPILLNSSAVRDSAGNYLRSRTTLTDLTERKRAEAAVRLFADVVRNVPIGLLIYQLDGTVDPPALRVRSGNPRAASLLGVPLEAAAGLPVVEVFPAIPEDQLHRYTAVAESGRADDLGEFRYGDARVAERWWAVLAFPLPERCVGIAFQDVTGRKQAEAEVRRLNEELEGRVAARTAELAEVNRDLVHKNAENEMFVYSVSHDLRSPLVNLQGFSKELEKGYQGLAALLADETVPPAVRERAQGLVAGKMAKSVGFIQTAVLRLSGIIDALLRLSRAGRVEYRWEHVDVSRVVEQVVAAAHGTIAQAGAVVRTHALPTAWGDRTAVEQVFANLIGNALAYLDPARPGAIEVGAVPDGAAGGEFRTFYVRDNGLGIPEAHQMRIFQAFQRAHPGVGKGEGLGLAIVSRAVGRHRGRVWVESTAGEGSTFYVTLPARAG